MSSMLNHNRNNTLGNVKINTSGHPGVQLSVGENNVRSSRDLVTPERDISPPGAGGDIVGLLAEGNVVAVNPRDRQEHVGDSVGLNGHNHF